MSKAKDILNVSRQQLADHIKYEIGLISPLVNDEGESVHIEEKDLAFIPTIHVKTYPSYMMDDEGPIVEERNIVRILMDEDGNVTLEDMEEDETDLNDLTTDEMADIAYCLEESYMSLINKD